MCQPNDHTWGDVWISARGGHIFIEAGRSRQRRQVSPMFGLWLFCALLRISRLVDRGVTSWYGGCVAYAMRDGVWNTPLCHSFWMAAEARLLGVS